MQVMFPTQLMANEARFSIIGQTQDVQQSLSGAETVVPAMGARWLANVRFVVKGRAAQLACAAFLAGMEGRLGTTLVPVRARWRAYDRNGKSIVQCLTAPLAGAGTFEHWGFAAAPTATCTVLVGAALRATRLIFALGNTTGLQPGQMFSIGERAYRVQLTWQDEAGRQVVQFQPPLREAAAAGTVMVLDAVQCRMRLQSESEEALSALGRDIQQIDLTFMESI
jgi:hypothetical protein